MSQKIAEEEIKLFFERITSNKDYLYIFQPYGLAYIPFAAGLSYAVQQKKNKSATVLIVNEGVRNFDLHYENVAKITYLSLETALAINECIERDGNYESDNYIYGYFREKNADDIIWREKLDIADCYRKNVFDLPMDTPLMPPTIEPLSDENIAYFNQEYVLDRERTIIITADILRDDLSEMKFWNDLAQQLQDRNYVVYTYGERFSNKPFGHTKMIFANCNELNYLADKVKCFICSRLGIMSYLAMTSAKIFSVVDFPSWFWDMKLNFPNSNSHTFYCTEKFINAFERSFSKDSLKVKMELSHPKMDSENIFYSYDKMLDKVLDVVEKD